MNGGGGGGGEESLPLEAAPDAQEKNMQKGTSKSGVGANREKGIKIATNWKKKGIQIIMIRVLAMWL